MPPAWWPILAVASFAAAWDIYCRRIPNWLVLPFFVAGLVVSGLTRGFAGAGASLAGVGVAVAAMGPICWMGGMGMGDLKLCAAIGAWIGPSQMLFALVVTAIAGGVIAACYALRRNSLGRSLDGAADLAGRLWGKRGSRRLALDQPGALAIPYAPAIAIGTLFAFLAQ
jgi:prepilin peptidase CpaA